VFAVALVTTLVVTFISHALPGELELLRVGVIDISIDANTLVGATFLLATWWTVLRDPEAPVSAYGLSLAGLTEAEPLSARRLLSDGGRALGWALLLAAIFFPPFWFGYRLFWNVGGDFAVAPPSGMFNRVMGQLLVIALPEEAFFRGYLQSALDAAWPRRLRVLGAEVGPGLLVACAIFAVGHMLTITHPYRLAVFFPALLFGWLRARTGGIGASVVFHAMCNLLSAYLAHGYGR
jgi:membrane protease YdiL (CAAX protease family)